MPAPDSPAFLTAEQAARLVAAAAFELLDALLPAAHPRPDTDALLARLADAAGIGLTETATDLPSRMADIERKAKARKVSLRALCAAVDIAPSTWTRWKAGRNSPTLTTWLRVEKAALAFLEADPGKAA